MIRLVNITKDNWQECIQLPTADDHARFVAPNVYSIAEAQFYPDTVTACAIYAGDAMVGFAMYGPDEDMVFFRFRATPENEKTLPIPRL